MEDGGWRMEDGGWRMEDGGWRMEDGKDACTQAPNIFGHAILHLLFFRHLARTDSAPTQAKTHEAGSGTALGGV
jgi:hypothetical protein